MHEAVGALAPGGQFGRIAPPGRVLQGRARDLPHPDAVVFGGRRIARGDDDDRDGERLHAGAPFTTTSTVTSSSILNIRNRGADRPSCRMSRSKLPLTSRWMSSSTPVPLIVSG